MRAFGFLSFGHYGGNPAQGGITAVMAEAEESDGTHDRTLSSS